MIDTIMNLKNMEYAPLENMWFKLREIKQVKDNSSEWQLKLQFFESHLLLVLSSGQGWLTVDGQFIELRQGSIYVCAPGQLVEAAAHSMDERGLYLLQFDVIEDEQSSVHPLQIVKHYSRFPLRGEVSMASPVSVTALCGTIYHNLQGEDFLRRFRSQILFQEVLFTILQDALITQGNDSEAMLESVKSYIEQHYQQELTIEHLAKVGGISSRHFMRLFKKRYGCSAIDYLTAFRIKQAQRLMMAGGSNRLKDIARHVGYPDDIYFRRKFKQLTGVPPGEFMKNSKLRIAAYDARMIGHLIALQVTPCAAPADHPWTDYYQRKYQTQAVVPLSSSDILKRKELQLAAPDYIIGIDSLVTPEEQARLREIAPTFLVSWLEDDWRTQLRLIAQFLDRTPVAEIWLKNYARKADFVREQVHSTIKEDRLLILRITGNQLNLLGNRSLATVFYDDLQVAPALSIDHLNAEQQLTPAQLTASDADRLLLIVDNDTLSQSTWRSLSQSQLWRGLRAVRNGRIDLLPAHPWVDNTAFTHELILDEALKLWRNRA